MNRWKRSAGVLICLCLLLPLFAPCAPARAADSAARWEMNMIRADFSARIDLLGQGVRVAVIDSGVLPLPALPGLEPGRDYTGQGTTSDDQGHGTPIAGILAGDDPGAAFRGVAPAASVIPLRCFTAQGGEVEAVASAIYDAVDEFSCRVINLSFGQKEDSEALREAVAYALAQGVTVVAAAGNYAGKDLFYPAAYEGVIAVNAVGSDGGIALDAQHNASVDLAAPGVRVLGPVAEGGYGYRSGSSFAVPFVAGAAAVLLSADESLSPAEIRDVLCRTAADRGEGGWDEYYGWGVLDLEAALREVLGPSLCWLSQPRAANGGVEVTVFHSGKEPFDGCCRFGAETLPLHLEPEEITRLRFGPRSPGEVCALWRGDASGGETRVSNAREWTGTAPEFTDVPPGAWFREAALAAAASGVMLGLPDGRFDPEGRVTRAMFVTVLYRAAGAPPAPAECPFSDVAAEAWYAPAVSWASACGLVSGVSEDSFDPEGLLSREALAVILMRMEAGKGREPAGKSLSDYPDASEVSPWALEGMAYCVGTGLMQGVSETELLPRGPLTRASLAVLLARLKHGAVIS